MRRSIAVLLLGVALPAFLACSGDEERVPVRALGCDPGVRDEFARQQRLVDWDVYCPPTLPEGFRLATASDAAGSGLGTGAAPTIDQLGPGGGTFITRLRDDQDREIVLVQGAGASIYVRRDESRCRGCFEVPRRGAMFGALSGRLFELDPPAVIAFDEQMGHMLIGYGVRGAAVTEIAAALRPVRPEVPSLADGLLRVVDLQPGAWLPDDGEPGDGEDFAQRPIVCADEVIETDATYVGAFFHGATWPYEDGHPPSLHQALFEFEDEAEAKAYMVRVEAAIDRCVAKQGSTTRRLPYESSVTDIAGFRESHRSDVQGSDIDLIFMRRGSRVTVLWYYELVAAGGKTDELKALVITRAALATMGGD